MTERINGGFETSEDWIVSGTINDSAGTPINLTGATVTFRLKSVGGTLIFDKTCTILDVVAATYYLRITAATIATYTLTDKKYDYEVKAVLQDGTVTNQTRGSISIDPSLF